MSDQGQFDKAESLYQRAQTIDPSNANLFVHRGLIALQAKGDMNTAIDLIEQSLKLDDK